ncbi:MAG: cytochrome c-type biogenesis protein CcmH, partial [Nitrospinae bacterium]|nr:cytochrome c-type biogenesis protein CcmH [Nitrospinota bacterium]
CKTTLKTCPHINCDFSIPRKKEILKMLDEGADYDTVVKAMVARFGEQILPAPTKEGFNLVGYLLPFVAILSVGAVLVRQMGQWARRGKAASPEVPAARQGEAPDEAVRRKMEQELADFD